MSSHAKNSNCIFFDLLLLISLIHSIVCGQLNVSDVKPGNSPSLAVQLFPDLKIDENSLSIRGSIIVNKAVDNENMANIIAYKENPITKNEHQILRHKEKGVCNMLYKCIGPVFLKIEKMAGVAKPGSCPIPIGNYTLKNYFTFDFTKVPALGMVPKGTYRLAGKMMSLDAKTVLGKLGVKFTKN